MHKCMYIEVHICIYIYVYEGRSLLPHVCVRACVYIGGVEEAAAVDMFQWGSSEIALTMCAHGAAC